jgi:hypothetical protein
MKRPEPSPADNLRRKKAGKKVGTILNNYHKRRLGIEGVKRKILEIDGLDRLNIALLTVDPSGNVHAPWGSRSDDYPLFYRGSFRMNSDDDQWMWFSTDERNYAVWKEKKESESMYCVTCGSDITDGTDIEFWYTEEKE